MKKTLEIFCREGGEAPQPIGYAAERVCDKKEVVSGRHNLFASCRVRNYGDADQTVGGFHVERITSLSLARIGV